MRYLLTRLNVSCPSEIDPQVCRELLADDLGDCGYESFEDTDEGINGYIQQDFYDEEALKETLKAFPIPDVKINYTTEDIPDQDWNAAWEAEGFEPIVVDGKVTIYDARNTPAGEQFNTEVQIGIFATNAFGTGTHETTQMMVSSLINMPLDGKRILDCGCGTGILAISALHLGAAEAIGYDIDEWSADNAMYNATINGVGDKMKALCGDASVLAQVEGKFDVVLANINRNILLADMEKFRSIMKSDATLLLSGFYEEDIPMLLQKASELGLHEEKRTITNNWSCVKLKVEN